MPKVMSQFTQGYISQHIVLPTEPQKGHVAITDKVSRLRWMALHDLCCEGQEQHRSLLRRQVQLSEAYR